jgi:hypothetical protein
MKFIDTLNFSQPKEFHKEAVKYICGFFAISVLVESGWERGQYYNAPIYFGYTQEKDLIDQDDLTSHVKYPKWKRYADQKHSILYTSICFLRGYSIKQLDNYKKQLSERIES